MGTEDIFLSFMFAVPADGGADHRDNFDTVLAIFDERFIPKRNLIDLEGQI